MASASRWLAREIRSVAVGVDWLVKKGISWEQEGSLVVTAIRLT